MVTGTGVCMRHVDARCISFNDDGVGMDPLDQQYLYQSVLKDSEMSRAQETRLGQKI